MKQLIADFSAHLKQALETIQETEMVPAKRDIHNVLILGLGGSGIGGSIISDLLRKQSKVPVNVNKGYVLPGYVNEHTLVITCSYSGNTEETLTAAISALNKKAMMACITSGGELKELARREKLNVLSMEGGNPPRSMFGYPFAFLLYLMEYYGIGNVDHKKDLHEAISILDNNESDTKAQAEEMAKTLRGKTVHLLATDGNLAVASRMRQQLNENAKMLCWESEIPEMNHNELVGWEGGSNDFAALFLRNDNDYKRNQKRIEIVKDIIIQKTDTVIELWSKGESAIARAAYLVHFGDWVSYYLSELNEVDIIDIKSIDRLKSELSKVPFGTEDEE